MDERFEGDWPTLLGVQALVALLLGYALGNPLVLLHALLELGCPAVLVHPRLTALVIDRDLIACANPEARLRVMLAGHCDQIGLMVKHIDENGFVWVDTIGGWGRAGGYFATDEEADTFEAELKATPSLALGTSEVSLLDMTEAFAAVRLGRTPLHTCPHPAARHRPARQHPGACVTPALRSSCR